MVPRVIRVFCCVECPYCTEDFWSGDSFCMHPKTEDQFIEEEIIESDSFPEWCPLVEC